MKFAGKVGFVKTVVNERSVASEVVTLVPYYGDIVKDKRRIITSDRIVGDFSIQNEVSIVADKFMMDNFAWIRFVEWRGTNWEVTNVEISYPRITLSLGGVYNA